MHKHCTCRRFDLVETRQTRASSESNPIHNAHDTEPYIASHYCPFHTDKQPQVMAAIVIEAARQDDDHNEVNPSLPPSSSSSTVVQQTFLTKTLALETEWDVGIGGGLWTTGLLLCQYMEENAAFFARVLKGKRVMYV